MKMLAFKDLSVFPHLNLPVTASGPLQLQGFTMGSLTFSDLTNYWQEHSW